MSDHYDMDTPPMWKRILAWQLRSQQTTRKPSQSALQQSTLQQAVADAMQQAEALTPAFIIARKSEIAVQRELAKVMW